MDKWRHMRTLVLIPALVIAAPGAKAANDIYTGNDLLKECRATEPGGVIGDGPSALANGAYDAGSCMGYMKAARFLVRGEAICVPAEVTTGQFRDVVIKYVNDHPDQRHRQAVVLTTLATLEAFPCK